MLRRRIALCALALSEIFFISPRALFAQSLPVEGDVDPPLPASWTKLREHLGDGMPTGAGVRVAQVEPYWQGGFMAFTNPPRGEFERKQIRNGSGLPDGISPHARTVGAIWYGNINGVAPGIADITAFEANEYLDHVIRWNETELTPDAFDLGGIQIVNNSWVYDGTAENAIRALRRADHQIDTQGVIYVNATHNSRYSNVPTLPASLYNGITVGRADAESSHGPTFFDGRGRAKPDIVVDTYATSYAVPVISGAAALLLEQGAQDPDARRPQVVKAIMLAGAEQPSDWYPGDSTPNDDMSHPLDWRYGAGIVRIDRNYDILAAPRASSLAVAPQSSWAFGELSESSAATYYIQVPTTQTRFSAALCWHRHHTGDFSRDAVLPLNLLTLELWRLDAQTLRPTSFVQISASPADNVQYIHRDDLAPGVYALRVVRQTDFDPVLEAFGLAWWSEGSIVRGDMNGDGQLNGFDLDPLLLAFFEPEEYVQQFPGINPQINGDTNFDGVFDFFDLDSFVALLIGQ